MGIYPRNHPQLVEDLLAQLGYSGEEAVTLAGKEHSVREALSDRCEISILTRPLVESLAGLSGIDVGNLLQSLQCDDLSDYLNGRDLLDLAKDASLHDVPPQELVDALRRLPARLYSIASSQKTHPYEAHLTITADAPASLLALRAN